MYSEHAWWHKTGAGGSNNPATRPGAFILDPPSRDIATMHVSDDACVFAIPFSRETKNVSLSLLYPNTI
jgi:hypothetical protein